MTNPNLDALREAVAWIVDPAALWDLSGVPGFPLAEAYAGRQEKALAKADAILALPSLAALIAKREGWRPIESAPRGQSVLIATGHRSVMVSRLVTDWQGKPSWEGGGYGDPPPAPTHWMPLPPPPQEPEP